MKYFIILIDRSVHTFDIIVIYAPLFLEIEELFSFII